MVDLIFVTFKEIDTKKGLVENLSNMVITEKIDNSVGQICE